MKKLFLLFTTILSFSGVAFAHCWYMGGWGHMMDYGIGGIFMWIIFLIVIGVATYLVVQATKSKGLESPFRETPVDILKKRYAKGEITKEEFERIKKDLES
jgi:putative membrane protein